MRNASMLARLSAIAGSQLGLFTRADAGEVGVTSQQLRRLVYAGIIEQTTPRVFRFSSAARSWHQDVLAACLDGGSECVASHRTAAALHGFDGCKADVIEVLVPMHVRHRRKNVIVHHTRLLPVVDRARVGLIPVTSKARTLIDLGAVAAPERVEEALDGAERDGALLRQQVATRYQLLRAPGRNGIGAMTQILDGRCVAEGVPRSVLERRMMRLLARAGLPQPVTGHRVRLAGGKVYVLDFAYVAHRLGLEVDGHGTHATRAERAADNTRMNALENSGWTIRRFTYEQVMQDSAAVVAAIRAALTTFPRL